MKKFDSKFGRFDTSTWQTDGDGQTDIAWQQRPRYGLRREVNIYAFSHYVVWIVCFCYTLLINDCLVWSIVVKTNQKDGYRVSFCNQPKGPFRPSASTHPIKLMLKIGSIHTERVDARQLICINQMSERCQFKLYIGYWTSSNNKWPKCSCRYQTPSPDNTCANDVIDKAMK